MPKQAMSLTMDVDANTSVAVLRRFLERCPEDAKVSVTTHQGDRFSMDWSTLKVSWSEEI